MRISKQFRWRVAAVVAPVTLVSFLAHQWLFESYFSSRPQQPQPEAGLIYALANHGSHVFISVQDSTGLALLMNVFFVAWALVLVIIPKQFALRPPAAPWIMKATPRFEWQPNAPPVWAIVLGSTVLSIAVIWLVGPAVVYYLLAHGVVLGG